MVHTVSTQAEFDNIIDIHRSLVVVDAFASWCVPCKALAPKLDAMETKYINVLFIKIDVEEVSTFADEYEVTAMPTIIFIKNGKEVDRVVGANEAQIIKCIEKHAE